MPTLITHLCFALLYREHALMICSKIAVKQHQGMWR